MVFVFCKAKTWGQGCFVKDDYIWLDPEEECLFDFEVTLQVNEFSKSIFILNAPCKGFI